MLAGEAAFTAVLLLIFCISHSILASKKVKKAFQKKFGNLIAFYRIVYNIFSVVLLVSIYMLLPQNDVILYTLVYPLNYAAIAVQLISIIGIIWSGKYFSFGELIGLNQIKRFRKGQYISSELDEKPTLRIEGPYKYSRHPVYFFSIIFLTMRPVIGLIYLIIVVIFVVYFYIGSIFEEKRLVENFGDVYLHYQKSVPRIFPIKIFRA